MTNQCLYSECTRRVRCKGTDYQKEFELNLKHQIEKVKHFFYVGYQIDNYFLFMLVFPKGMLPIK